MISSIFADPQGAKKDYTDLRIRLCDRRCTGIGVDGLAILVPFKKPAMCMRIINSDGSEEKCAAMQYVALPNTLTNTEKLLKKLFTIETLAGVMKPTLTIENGIVTQVTVDMGKPFLQPKTFRWM